MVGLSTTIFVSILSQPKIFMAIADDGLLWPKLKEVNPKTQVPITSTFITGIGAMIFGMFFKYAYLASAISLTYLFGYGCVSLGILANRYRESPKKALRMVLTLLIVILSMVCGFMFTNEYYLSSLIMIGAIAVCTVIFALIPQSCIPKKFKCPWVPFLPILSTFSNFFMCGTVDWYSWTVFVIFMLIGVVIYFAYSQKHSVLNKEIHALISNN